MIYISQIFRLLRYAPIRTHLLSDLNLTLGDERAGDGGSEQVDALVLRIGPASDIKI